MTIGSRMALKLPSLQQLVSRNTTNIEAARELQCSKAAVSTMVEYLNYNGWHIRQVVSDHGVIILSVLATGEK